jgi:hypothetical protein
MSATYPPRGGPIDTTNLFWVGVKGEAIVVMRPRQHMTKAEALNLAAYLVVLADENDEFPALLEAVKNT